MQALHLSEEFARTERRQARYRGYDIKMERPDLCWMVTMKRAVLSFPYSSGTHSRPHSQNEKPSRRRGGGSIMF
jgi:hypothetical protein